MLEVDRPAVWGDRRLFAAAIGDGECDGSVRACVVASRVDSGADAGAAHRDAAATRAPSGARTRACPSTHRRVASADSCYARAGSCTHCRTVPNAHADCRRRATAIARSGTGRAAGACANPDSGHTSASGATGTVACTRTDPRSRTYADAGPAPSPCSSAGTWSDTGAGR